MHYPIWRRIGAFLICSFLGAVWSATTVPVLGVFAALLRFSEIAWHLTVGILLFCSLLVVHKIVIWNPRDEDDADRDYDSIDTYVCLIGFASAYILVWILVRDFV